MRASAPTQDHAFGSNHSALPVVSEYHPDLSSLSGAACSRSLSVSLVTPRHVELSTPVSPAHCETLPDWHFSAWAKFAFRQSCIGRRTRHEVGIGGAGPAVWFKLIKELLPQQTQSKGFGRIYAVFS
ncbi:hypothetical protein ACOYQJ_15495 [Primorskyibacter sp. 2E233]